MSEDTELKPCPFCGTKAKAWKSGSRWFVRCSNDGCPIEPSYYLETKAEAIAAWNTRPGEQAAAAQAVEAERGRIKVAVYDMIEEYADNTNISGHLLGFVAGFADRIMTTINAENK